MAPDGKNVTNVQETRRGGSPIDQTGSNQRRAKVMVCDLGGFTWVNFRSNMRTKLAPLFKHFYDGRSCRGIKITVHADPLKREMAPLARCLDAGSTRYE
jgi:hypothetical protein